MAPENGKPLLIRWLTENRADTRTPGPPAGRRYMVPFARVWNELRALVREEPRWQLQRADEVAGVLSATCRSRVFGFVDDLTVWISLDEDGLTRVEARSRSRTGTGDLGVNRRRVEGLLDRLDRRLGA